MDQRPLISLHYFDKASFTTTPCVHYACAQVGKPRELPCFLSKRLNVLGFVFSQGDSGQFVPVPGNVTSAFDTFSLGYSPTYRKLNKPGVVVLDNASYHTTKAIRERQGLWASRGVMLYLLPPIRQY